MYPVGALGTRICIVNSSLHECQSRRQTILSGWHIWSPRQFQLSIGKNKYANVCQAKDIFSDVVNFNLSDKVVFLVLDAGSGHASATCSGGVLHLRLQNTKRIRDVTKIQYAARPKTRWAAGDHPMSSCDVNKCRLTDGGKTLEVDVPNAHGKNYIVP